MRNGIYNGIGDGSTLSNQSWHNGDQRCNFVLISKSSLQNNCCIRSPHCYPKRYIDHGDFCNSNFSALSILVGVRTERCYIHFLRLISQCLFVVDDSIDDVIVTKYDDDKRHAIVKYEETASIRNSLR